MRALILLCQAWWSCPLLLLSRLFLARSCSYSACLNGKQNVFIETRELGNDQGRDWYSYLFGKTVVMCAKSWLVNRKFCSFAFLHRGGLDPVQFTAWMARILPWKGVLTLQANIFWNPSANFPRVELILLETTPPRRKLLEVCTILYSKFKIFFMQLQGLDRPQGLNNVSLHVQLLISRSQEFVLLHF